MSMQPRPEYREPFVQTQFPLPPPPLPVPRQPPPMPPGLYHNDQDPPGLLRWWTGVQWAEQTEWAHQTQPPPSPSMVTESPRHTSHGIHLFLSIITGGLWIPVWIGFIIVNKNWNEKHVTTRY